MTYLDYLVSTATPGGSMSTYGTRTALGRLDPTFAQNLAAAIKQARDEGINAGVYSAYRSPRYTGSAFDRSGRSLHSFGEATDISGIGRPGSDTAKRWYEIATANGLFNPYGWQNSSEWNHYQGVPEKTPNADLVKAFQTKAGLKVDGIIGPQTLAALNSAANLSGDYAMAYAPAATPPAPTPAAVAATAEAAGTKPFIPPKVPLPGMTSGDMGTDPRTGRPTASAKPPTSAASALMAAAMAAAKAGQAFQPNGQPGPQGGGIVSGPSGTFQLNGDGTYTSLKTGRTFSLNPQRGI